MAGLFSSENIMSATIRTIFALTVSLGMTVSSARADGPINFVTNTLAPSVAWTLPNIQCKVFPLALDREVTVSLKDATTEPGQWLKGQVDAGWLLHSMDFEVGQKPTGYPQGWLYLCVTKPS